MTFNDDRSAFTGSSSFADDQETSNSTFSGTISPDGTVNGTFSGTGTENVMGGTIATTDSGDITGTIDPDGNYSVSWTGNEPDSRTGRIDGFRIAPPGEESPPGELSTVVTRERDGGSDVVVTGEEIVANGIVSNIRAVKAECARLAPEFRVDCLAQGLRMTADRMPRTGRFGLMRRDILDAASKLDAIVARDGDRRAPRHIAARGDNPRFALKRSYVPIRRDRIASAIKQADAVVAELETKLLRASSGPVARANHYQRVAAAFGSVKVLFRS